MLKKKNTMTFVTFLITLSIFSGILTYKFVVDKSSEKPVIQIDAEKIKTENNSAIKKIKQHIESEFAINDVFNEVEKVNLISYVQSSNVIEIMGKNKGIIVANFKALQKERVSEEEVKDKIFDLDLYDYEIDSMTKGIKIRFYNEDGYMIVEKKEDNKDIRYVYDLRKQELENFVKILEEIYLNELQNKIFYPLPDKIYINARDENALYVAKKREIKNLVSKIKILSIEDREEYIGVPTIYPSYDITFNRDLEYKFYLKSDELMIINTPILYLYCKYDKELWDYVVNKLPQENNAKEDELKYLLKSERVVVKDLEGIYDLTNATYYNTEIPRQILMSDLNEIVDESQTNIDEDLRFVLKFYINEEVKEVLIYDNYIDYEGSLYYSKNIGENIRSTLMMP